MIIYILGDKLCALSNRVFITLSIEDVDLVFKWTPPPPPKKSKIKKERSQRALTAFMCKKIKLMEIGSRLQPNFQNSSRDVFGAFFSSAASFGLPTTHCISMHAVFMFGED